MSQISFDDEIPAVDAVPVIIPHDRTEDQPKKQKKKQQLSPKDGKEVSEQEFNAACFDLYDDAEHKRRICGDLHIIDRES